MSFVQRLRMANMFPIHSDLGDARINIGSDDDMYRVIEAAKDLALWNRNILNGQPSGLQTVGNQLRQPMQQEQPQLRFGGMFDSGSNPGADILSRARQSDQNSGQPPTNQMIERPISADEAHYGRYLDRKNKEKVADATLETAKGNAGYKQAQLENANERLRHGQERIDLTRDKNKTQAELDQAKFDLTKSKAENEKLSQDTLKKNQRDSIVTRAQAALEELNRLMNDKGELTTRGRDAFGGINNMISKLPISTDSYDASTTRERLKNLLTLDLLGEMKAQSKTGATGFGQMNIKELGVLENAASRLGGKLSDLDAPGALNDVKKYLNLILADEPNNQDFEILIDPRGIPRQIPKNQVEEALRRGARRQ